MHLDQFEFGIGNCSVMLIRVARYADPGGDFEFLIIWVRPVRQRENPVPAGRRAWNLVERNHSRGVYEAAVHSVGLGLASRITEPLSRPEGQLQENVVGIEEPRKLVLGIFQSIHGGRNTFSCDPINSAVEGLNQYGVPRGYGTVRPVEVARKPVDDEGCNVCAGELLV